MTRGGVNDEILPEPEGFPEGSGNISLYTLTLVMIQPFSITSTSQYFLILTPWACNIFLYSPREQVNIFTFWGLCHGSFKSSLGNMLCLEGNIATVIFQYSIVRRLRICYNLGLWYNVTTKLAPESAPQRDPGPEISSVILWPGVLFTGCFVSVTWHLMQC